MRIFMFRALLAIHLPPIPEAFHVNRMYNYRRHLANLFYRMWEPEPHSTYRAPFCACSLEFLGECKGIGVLLVLSFSLKSHLIIF
jgi:hypothetical protein